MSQYCAPQDVFTYALPPKALPADVTPTQQTAACVAASAEADSYLRARYSLPLSANYPLGGPFTTFDPALVRHVAYIAAYILMARRGFAALQGTPDDTLVRNYEKAIEYFKGVERQNIHLDVVQATVTAPNYQLPQVRSHTPRGI